MFETRYISPAAQGLTESSPFASLQEVLSLSEPAIAVVGRQRGRDVVKITLSADDEGEGARPTYYLKREFRAARRELCKHLLAGHGICTKSLWEWQVLRALRSEGILVPEPLLCLQRVAPWPAGCLLTAALPEAMLPLNVFLHDQLQGASRRERGEFLERLAGDIARLHGTGFDQPDLFAPHIWVDSQSETIGFLDFQHSRRYRHVPARLRARDLGALVASVPSDLFGEDDRSTLLGAYCRYSDLDNVQSFTAWVQRTAAFYLRRRRVWEMRASGTPESRHIESLQALDEGRLMVAPSHLARLTRARLTTFAAMKSFSLQPESTKLATSAEGRLRAAYRLEPAGRWPNWFPTGLASKPTMETEAKQTMRLGLAGLTSARVLALGRRRQHAACQESLLLIEEPLDFVPLTQYLAAADETCRHKALKELSGVVARLHRVGYFHPRLSLDVFAMAGTCSHAARVQVQSAAGFRAFKRFRAWRTERDLLHLLASFPTEMKTPKAWLLFLKDYWGSRRLSKAEKQTARRLLRRLKLIRRKEGDSAPITACAGREA